jgi:type IX secretion system PorP/SprF family membrane protein
MAKNLLSYLLFLISLSVADAQQLPLYAQHPEYHGLINAASVNSDFLTSERTTSIGISHRKQWSKLANAPSTQVVRWENIHSEEHFLIGGYLQQDRVGITENASINGRFAYIIKTSDDIADGGISIGLNIGLAYWQLKTSLLTLAQIDDPNLPPNPSLWYPDIGLGVYWYKNLGNPSHYVYAGFSMPRTFDFQADKFIAKRYPHYYGLLGYYAPFFNDGFWEVSTWTRYVENIPLQSSFNGRIKMNEYFSLGAGIITDYKDKPFFMAEFGLTKDRLKIGIAYSWSSTSQYFGTAYEVNVAFLLGKID